MRALGIDLGSKTIGLATSDELGLTANPRVTLARQGTKKDVLVLADICAKENVSCIVVGLPLGPSGEETTRSGITRKFCGALERALLEKGSPLPIDLWDERFSTRAVETLLIAADLSRARRKQVIDRAAAAYILQGWLDARGRG